jgi:hypothetical protein
MKQAILSIILMLLPMLASAEPVEINGIFYNLTTKTKQAEVTINPNQYSGEVIVPETVEYNGITYVVTSIDDKAFYACYDLTSITIPDSVSIIGDQSFYSCYCLSNLKIGNGVTSIGVGAFTSCSGLTSISMPNSLLSIGRYAFSDCTSIKSITISSSITSIGEMAFYGCESLTSVHITDLERWLNIYFEFQYSNPLNYAHHLYLNGNEIKDLVIPNNVTRINDYAFLGCSGITSVMIPESVNEIGIYAFKDCTGLTSVKIPNSVTKIGAYAFSGCNGLTSIIIGNRVKFIEGAAFEKCKELLEVYCYAPDVPYTQDPFNQSFIEYASLHIPESAMDNYKTTEPWSRFKEFVTLPNFKLTYYVDDEVYKIYKYEEERPIPNEQEPIKEGYSFSGWSDIPEMMPAHDVDVKGTFTINIYNLIYVVDGEIYKTVEVEYGSTITPETEPLKEGYVFKGWSEIPETMPARNVWVYGYFDELSLGKCVTPTISYSDGRLYFMSETEGADFIYSINDNDIKAGNGNEVQLEVIYQISVYATKPGYENSDVATATLCWIDADPANEGITNGVANIRVKALLIQNTNNVFTISGTDIGTSICVFDTSGKMIGSATSTSDITNVPTSLQPGNIALLR